MLRLVGATLREWAQFPSVTQWEGGPGEGQGRQLFAYKFVFYQYQYFELFINLECFQS